VAGSADRQHFHTGSEFLAFRNAPHRPQGRRPSGRVALSALAPLLAVAAFSSASSRISSSRFAPSAANIKVTPVTLPPGLLRLATRPLATGSPPMLNTIGIVAVDALAASPDASPPVAAITATRRPTSSAANAGSRSYWPSAQRYSIVTYPLTIRRQFDILQFGRQAPNAIRSIQTARVHHPSRRHGGVAARGARAAAGGDAAHSHTDKRRRGRPRPCR
jgi:hypothetical protein